LTNDHQQLRRQIHDHIAQPVASIEQKIAAALLEGGEFHAYLNDAELGIIMRKVLYTLVDEQKVAGLSVPIVHNVSEMRVKLDNCEATIECETHIHAPITAFIRFKYILENDRRAPGRKLHLKNNSLEVKETTKAFDLAAKAILRVIGVRDVTNRELSDPNAVILRTLPPQLEQHGFAGKLKQVDLELMDDCTLRVHLLADGAA
jgi:hypothetical protein